MKRNGHKPPDNLFLAWTDLAWKIGEMSIASAEVIAHRTARMTAVKVIGRYVGLWLWPARLSFDYSYNEIPLFGWADWRAVFALIVCGADGPGAGLTSTTWSTPMAAISSSRRMGNSGRSQT